MSPTPVSVRMHVHRVHRTQDKIVATGVYAVRIGGVTAPREVLPGRFYLVTRRCTQRQFLLTPCPRTNQIVRFALALAAKKSGVRLHAVCFMSNHWHGVVSDPSALLPIFLEHLHRLIAKAQNAWLKRRENFWSSERTSVVHLATPSDVLEKMAYTIANPTSAMLVRSPDEWPGVLSHWEETSAEVEMPDVFFDRYGDLPRKVSLDIVRPQIFEQLTDDQLSRLLLNEVGKLVQRARDATLVSESQFVGVQAVLNQRFDAKPSTEEKLGALNPRIAAESPPVRVRTIQKMQAFVKAYRAAWLRWREGIRDVVFPAGTYALRLHSGVTCAPC
jgi:putative transposase